MRNLLVISALIVTTLPLMAEAQGGQASVAAQRRAGPPTGLGPRLPERHHRPERSLGRRRPHQRPGA